MKRVSFVLTLLVLLVSKSIFSQVEPLDNPTNYPYKDGEILVRYLSATPEQARNEIRSQMGDEVGSTEYIVPNLELIKLNSGQTVEEALSYYNNMPGILYASPNYIVYATAGIFPPRPAPSPDPTPDPFGDPFFDRSYGITTIGAPKAWNQFSIGNRSVVVGVIDTGVDYTHEDLSANMWKNANEIPGNGIDDDHNGFIDDVYGWNFVDNNNNPFDDNHHGTHVAGTIGAMAGNGLGTIGVSPKVSIMACKFLSKDGWGTVDAAIKSITYAVNNGAKILNNSWGGAGFSQPLLDTIKVAEQAGVLFIAAAGNSNNDNDKSPMYPASYDAANIISVAATDFQDQKATFSSYGKKTVDLGAPGVAVFSTLPNNSYGTLSGTSMATPHVSGAAALIWAYKPNLTVYDLKDLIMKTTDQVPSMKDTTVSGGRLNVYNAMAFSLLSF